MTKTDKKAESQDVIRNDKNTILQILLKKVIDKTKET